MAGNGTAAGGNGAEREGVVLCTSPFIPPEWVAAHGFLPRRLRPRAAGGGEEEGAGRCPYAAAAGAESTSALAAGRGGAAIFATTCDQMRRVAGEAPPGAPLFLLDVPHTWQTPAAFRLYLAELRRLGRFLEALGGAAPTPAALCREALRYDAARTALRDVSERLSGVARARLLALLAEAGPAALEAALAALPPEAAAPRGAGRVALVGGPLRRGDEHLFDLVAAAGGDVVLDATEFGERTLPARLDGRRLREDPLVEIAAAHFGALPDAFRRPNSPLFRWLRGTFAARRVQALLLVRHIWCDLWHAEGERLAEWANLPTVAVELGAGGGAWERARTRLETLLEVAR